MMNMIPMTTTDILSTTTNGNGGGSDKKLGNQAANGEDEEEYSRHHEADEDEEEENGDIDDSSDDLNTSYNKLKKTLRSVPPMSNQKTATTTAHRLAPKQLTRSHYDKSEEDDYSDDSDRPVSGRSTLAQSNP